MKEIKSMDKRKQAEAEIEEMEQYVTFTIGSEVYGVEVLKVQEIIGMTQITHMPNSMRFMKGVINLRGSVVPVVDMRLKLEMEEQEYTKFTVILIIEVKGTLVGIIVDAVSDVVGLPLSSIQETPHFSANIDTDYIKGIAKKAEQLIIVLDVDKILSSEELERLDKNRDESLAVKN
ncbi:MAG TPA: chemotaxis protein CheW [Spirochaetota bacterium]|nr:chemotaxis protein CheW [Spirochaetota bacterium]HPJ37435.1 chemotaxis protein CheW [Spirochaetota bacterium]HPQ52827.1 chemotaxis protein CheW [Spirochaetota bacterium]